MTDTEPVAPDEQQTFTRLLAPAPPDWTGLTYPNAVTVNEVDVDGVPHVAVYFNGSDPPPISENDWVDYVEAFVPVGPPTGPSLADVNAVIQASPDLSDAVKAALAQVLAAVESG